MSKQPTVAVDVRSRFQDAGFEVIEVSGSPGSIAIKKDNCTRLLERDAAGAWALSGPPLFSVRGLECKLEDQGYQKFWCREGKRFPIRVDDLKTLHRFDQEVRAILGLKSLYHESLDTTCARSVYDRLSGRPDT
jgi:hypothetical protein